eukprot:TRINITY_DN1385_c0_g1_i6.p1 TRINITY_DN1385_c0_g1~~TRINITY_DN1385_c0_g1_i6.p1  ORF type:complete len:1121 (-),score=310.44 TRINITY_DN1385_c0_g1_i6:71-3433(-)
MHMFGAEFSFSGEEKPRANFDDVWWAFVTVFQIFTGEDWNSVLYNGIRSRGWWSSIFFISFVIIGVYILFNLLLAILIENFGRRDEEEMEHNGEMLLPKKDARDRLLEVVSRMNAGLEGNVIRKMRSMGPLQRQGTTVGIRRRNTIRQKHSPLVDGSLFDELKREESVIIDSPSTTAKDGGRESPRPETPPRPDLASASGRHISFRTLDERGRVKKQSPPSRRFFPLGGRASPAESDEEPHSPSHASASPFSLTRTPPMTETTSVGSFSMFRTKQSSPVSPRGSTIEEAENSSDGEKSYSHLKFRSLLLFKSGNSFRLWLHRVVHHRFFEPVILLVIVLSSIALAFETPNDSRSSTKYQILHILDIIFVVIFSVEMMMKIVVFGFIAHKDAYLRSAWNVLDFLIVMLSIASLVFEDSNLRALRAFRLLRTLRPLRLISRSSGMRMVVYSMLQAIPAIVNVFIVLLLFHIIFGIMGLQFFMGKFYSCNDSSVKNKSECIGVCAVGSKCEGESRSWDNATSHFNHIFAACLTLFEVSTLEGWLTVMYNAVDMTDVDEQPQRDHQPLWAIFFIIFIVIGAFFLFSLFVGIITEHFQKIKKENDVGYLMTPAQKEWVQLQQLMVRQEPIRLPDVPDDPARRGILAFVTSKKFEVAMMIIIVINILLMATEHYGQPDTWAEILYYSNIAFVSIFVLEAILKIYALGMETYFADNWNRFDFFVVVISVLAILANFGMAMTSLRVVRVIRIFRIVKSARGLMTVFHTFLYSMPALINVGSLLGLLFFMYAVLGVSIFGKVKPHKPLALNHRANFHHFGYAMLMLIRVTTGEAWNDILRDTMVQPPHCDDEKDECGTEWAPLYFITFILIASYALLNMFIAVIFEDFGNTLEQSHYVLTPEHLEKYATVWARFDPKATRYIPAVRLPDLVWQLPPPLGSGESGSRLATRRLCVQFEIPAREGSIQFLETLHTLAMSASQRSFSKEVVCGKEDAKAVMRKMNLMLQGRISRMDSDGKSEGCGSNAAQITSREILAAETIQAVFRGSRVRNAVEETLRLQGHHRRVTRAMRARKHVENLLGPSTMQEGSISDEMETPSKSFSRIVENSVMKMSYTTGEGDDEENDPFGDM